MPNFIPVLSDHAYQSALITTTNLQTKVELRLSVGSWNLLDRGFSKITHTRQEFSNNPFDADETLENYEKRKRTQFNKIEQNIRKHPEEDGDDIVFLQEVDFLLAGKHPALAKLFKDMLDTYDFGLVVTEPSKAPFYAQQPMALIYNKKRLLLHDEGQGVFPAPADIRGAIKYRGYESIFTEQESNQQIVLTNIHLLYGHDYSLEMQRYRMVKEIDGFLNIIGGDTNGTQRLGLATLLGDEDIATNFSKDPFTGALTTEQIDPTDPQRYIPKAYDRLFGIPPLTCSLAAHPTSRREQVSISITGKAVCKPALKHRYEQRFYFFKTPAKSDFNTEQQILELFSNRADKCVTHTELEEETQKIKNSPAYKISVLSKEFFYNFSKIYEKKRSSFCLPIVTPRCLDKAPLGLLTLL